MVDSRNFRTGTITLKRPECLDDAYPEVAALKFTAPPALGSRIQWFSGAVTSRLEKRIRDAHQVMRQRGVSFPAALATF